MFAIVAFVKIAAGDAGPDAVDPSLGWLNPFAIDSFDALVSGVATILMGALSIAWYVGLTLVSENILFDSIAALGLMIAFYYGLTGFACAVFYRRQLLRNARTLLLAGVAPVIGGLVLFGLFGKSIYDFTDPANSESGDSWLGVGPPLIIGVGFLVLGAFLMVLWWATGHREFFRRRTEVAPADLLDGSPAA